MLVYFDHNAVTKKVLIKQWVKYFLVMLFIMFCLVLLGLVFSRIKPIWLNHGKLLNSTKRFNKFAQCRMIGQFSNEWKRQQLFSTMSSTCFACIHQSTTLNLVKIIPGISKGQVPQKTKQDRWRRTTSSWKGKTKSESMCWQQKVLEFNKQTELRQRNDFRLCCKYVWRRRNISHQGSASRLNML